jgi:predicted component of type VI protein secretion system
MRFRFVDLDVLRQSLAGARTSPAELLQDGAATPLAVCSPIFVIGRQRGADLRLSGKLVSKVHAILYEHAGKHILRDLSSQGTLVDGQRIRSVELQGGETIEICGLHVRYRSSPSAELMKAPAPQPPEAATAPLHSARLDADSSAHAEEEENDAPGEQHVFAPEPEILSPATASHPGSPDDGLQTLEPEEDSVWEHAENAGDLIDWGITLEPEITGPATPPEAVTALQERSGVHAGIVTALPNPSDTDEIVAPMPNICVISEPVDLTMLRRETARPVEARAAAAPQAMRTTETKTSASPPQSTSVVDTALSPTHDDEPPLSHDVMAPASDEGNDPVAAAATPLGGTQKLQPLDGILGQGILTMAPVDELTEEAAPPRSRAAPRRLFRLLWVAIVAGLLLALAVVAWWHRYRNR